MLFKKLYYYYHHYKMWDHIVTHLRFDSDELLNDTNYIGRLKKMFIKVHCHKQVYWDCFLCDLYKDTQKERLSIMLTVHSVTEAYQRQILRPGLERDVLSAIGGLYNEI